MNYLKLHRMQHENTTTPQDPIKLLRGLAICFAATVFMAMVIRIFAPGTSGIDGWSFIRDIGLAVVIFAGACGAFLHKRMTAQIRDTKETPEPKAAQEKNDE